MRPGRLTASATDFGPLHVPHHLTQYSIVEVTSRVTAYRRGHHVDD